MSALTTRRRFLYLVGFVSGGGLLAACSQASPPQPTAAPATAPPAKPTAPAATSAPVAPAAAPTAAPAAAPTTAPPPVGKPGQAVPKDHPTIAALYDDARKDGKVSWWDQHEQDVAQQFIDA